MSSASSGERSPTAKPRLHGEVTLLVGEPIRNRVPCNGDDLAHYSAADLGGVDGVLFNTCEISWVGGGTEHRGSRRHRLHADFDLAAELLQSVTHIDV